MPLFSAEIREQEQEDQLVVYESKISNENVFDSTGGCASSAKQNA